MTKSMISCFMIVLVLSALTSCSRKYEFKESSEYHYTRDLYDLLSDIWCADTCAPRMREGWSKENKTLGQCSITAFLAQDIFGGEVYGILRSDGNYHCYNVIGDCVFDLSSEQLKNVFRLRKASIS